MKTILLVYFLKLNKYVKKESCEKVISLSQACDVYINKGNAMDNRNIPNDLDQLFQFVRSETPLSQEDLLTCKNLIRSIQSQDSRVLNTPDSYGLTPLMKAARNQHREILNSLLAAKADPNIQTEFGMTALIFCARDRNRPDNDTIAKDLIDAGANMDLAETWGPTGTALINAIDYNKHKIAKLLIEEKANINIYGNGWTALHRALHENHKEIVLRLLNANAQIPAYMNGDDECRKMEKFIQLFKNYKRYSSIDESFTLEKFLSNPELPPPNRSALLEDKLISIILNKEASSDKNITELRHYLKEIKAASAPKDTPESTGLLKFVINSLQNILFDEFASEEMPKPDINDALILAARYQSTQFIIELLKAGADINYVDQWGRSALRESLYDKEKFALLLKQGADVHINRLGSQCLVHLCYCKSRVSDVQILIQKGVDINYINDEQGEMEGRTPLIASIISGDEAVFDELLKAGVDINKEDAHGRTPLYWAIDRERRAMIHKLIDTNAGCFYSQKDLNQAKEVDNSVFSQSKVYKSSLHSYLTKLQETHPSSFGKTLLINQLDEEIRKHYYPTVLLDLIASYDKRYNQNCFFRCSDNIENKVEQKPEQESKPELKFKKNNR